MLIANNEANKNRIAYILTTNAGCEVAFDSCIELAQKGVLPLVAIGSKQQNTSVARSINDKQTKVYDPKTPCVNRKNHQFVYLIKSNQNKKSQQTKKINKNNFLDNLTKI